MARRRADVEYKKWSIYVFFFYDTRLHESLYSVALTLENFGRRLNVFTITGLVSQQ